MIAIVSFKNGQEEYYRIQNFVLQKKKIEKKKKIKSVDGALNQFMNDITIKTKLVLIPAKYIDINVMR